MVEIKKQRKKGYIICIGSIIRGNTHFAAVPFPVYLGRGKAERQRSRVRQGREKIK